MESAGWDSLLETHQLVADMVGLLQAPLRGETRVRIALLTYCHLTEVDAMYSVIENLLRTIEGKRWHVDPFGDLYRRKGSAGDPFSERIPASAKTVVTRVRKHAEEIAETELSELLAAMFDEDIRNSFFHSDYIIHSGEYRTREGKFRRGSMITSALPLTELALIVNRALGFYDGFMRAYLSHLRGYKTPKIVSGRFLGESEPPMEIELLVDPERGVYGFRSPPQPGAPPPAEGLYAQNP